MYLPQLNYGMSKTAIVVLESFSYDRQCNNILGKSFCWVNSDLDLSIVVQCGINYVCVGHAEYCHSRKSGLMLL